MNPTSYFFGNAHSRRCLLRFETPVKHAFFSGTPGDGCTTVELCSTKIAVVFSPPTPDRFVTGHEDPGERA